MKLLANEEGRAGIEKAVAGLRSGVPGIDAIVAAVTEVERSTEARSVGYGGWPNLLGEMEFDASVMDGDTLESGAVGALTGIINAVGVARLVKDRSAHQILVGQGARRFAVEGGFAVEETLYSDSQKQWQATLQRSLTPQQWKEFPHLNLADIEVDAANPEQLRDTTVYLCRDAANSMATASSTSGWAWKYPGRLGDAPVCGAGFYADSEFGAAACTHTGEMAIRAATASTVIGALKAGKAIREATDLAVRDLKRLKSGFLAGVVIHVLDAQENHLVVNFRCNDEIRYWLWDDRTNAPQLRDADVVVE